ncbi:MAG: alpha/beta hydrolase [Pseudobdellovibrionaceae bacterium]
MQFEVFGNKTNPALVCVPGLLGGPEDFRAMTEVFEKDYYIMIMDPNSERRKLGLSNLTQEVMQEVSFNSSANDIADALKDTNINQAYLLGVSLGGKIVYDFAIKFPELFLGGVITDVGPGSFEDSELYRFVDKIVQETNLNLTWPELKIDLQNRIADRSMRSLIQTQITYPNQKPPGNWKTAMKNFRKMLHRQNIDDQFEGLKAVDCRLIKQGSTIDVLQSQYYSGISLSSVPKIQLLKSIRLHSISNSSHFIHITHKPVIQDLVAKMLQRWNPSN